MTTADYLNQLEQDRSDLVDNLETQGITRLSGDETFTELVPEVLNISGGGADLSEYFEPTLGSGSGSSSGVLRMIKKLPNNTTISGTSLAYAFSGALFDEIPLLDTSNVTDMQYMCVGMDITTFPLLDTSNVTNMSHMVASCEFLTTLPLLNTSKVENFAYFVSSCDNFVDFPAIDTSSATNISYMFYNNNVQNLPILDFSSVTNMTSAFSSCNRLTDNSLNNILASLLTATSYTGTKTLRAIGLSSSQRNTCITLSNWAALETAGWTKG